MAMMDSHRSDEKKNSNGRFFFLSSFLSVSRPFFLSFVLSTLSLFSFSQISKRVKLAGVLRGDGGLAAVGCLLL